MTAQVGGNLGQKRSGLKTQVSDTESQQEAVSAPEEEEDDFWG